MEQVNMELVREMLAKREAEFREWYEALPEEKRSRYDALPVTGDEALPIATSGDQREKNRLYHLKKCRDILDLMESMKNEKEETLTPLGMRIEGTTAVVLVKVPGHPVNPGHNQHRLELREAIRSGERGKITADFNPNEFGIKAEQIEFLPGIKSDDWTIDRGGHAT